MDQAHITGAMATPKGLRLRFGVACIEKDILITVIQKWLDHASPLLQPFTYKSLALKSQISLTDGGKSLNYSVEFLT